MPRRFFELHDDVYAQERWHLKVPVDSQGNEVNDPWQFTRGRPIKEPGRLRVPYDVPGRPLDYSHGNLNIPLVNARVANLFTELAPQDVQLLPVEVEEQPDPYFILVATRSIRCIDEAASTIRRWTPEDGVPEVVGEYMSVRDLHIDKARVGDARVFRPEGWEVVLTVSEEIKVALERIQATGVSFTEVP
jgi:hypothetical protein